MNVYEIIENYLTANGYDGLWCADCGCKMDDLLPCNDASCLDCEPGYLHKAPAHDWYIRAEKPATLIQEDTK